MSESGQMCCAMCGRPMVENRGEWFVLRSANSWDWLCSLMCLINRVARIVHQRRPEAAPPHRRE